MRRGEARRGTQVWNRNLF